MNEVQRNFKRQQKQIEQDYKHRWRKERYKDRYTGKKYLRYYDEHGTLLKTEEVKNPFGKLAKALLFILGLIIALGVIFFIYIKFHVLIW